MSNPTPPKQIIHRQPGKHISDTPPDHRCWEIADLRDALAAAHLGRDEAVRERDELRTQLDARWIKCSERMPPAGDTVIVTFANQGGVSFTPSFAAWSGDVWDNDNWNRPSNREAVTHWQPLPAPPAQQSEERKTVAPSTTQEK